MHRLITNEYLFFWKDQFSQWYKSNFTIDDITFSSCEQYMMYKKAMLFGDDKIAELILLSDEPVDQKALGRKVKNFDRDIWDEHCFSFVYQGNYAKFSQNEELKNQLQLTGDRIIVEASPYDKIWGIKMDVGDDSIENPENWRGQNLLGFAIMTVRKNLQ